MRYNGIHYTFALALPPLMYLTPTVRKLSGGTVLGWQTLQIPDTAGALYVQGQRVHGHAYGQTELVGTLDRAAGLLREAEAPMRALLVGATQATGELVLDMVLGCRTPEAEDVLLLQGHTESLLVCLHPRPHWQLKGHHLQMPCSGTLKEDLADLRLGAETLAELER